MSYNETIAAVDGLRYAAGLYILNRDFRSYNPNLYTGTKTVDEGGSSREWELSPFADWYKYDIDANAEVTYYNLSGTGSRFAEGYSDNAALYMTTDSTSSTIDIDHAHRVGAVTAYTEFIPFSRFYSSDNYARYLQCCFTAILHASCTEGTHFRVAVAQYDSDYDYLAYDLVNLSGVSISSSAWTRVEAATTGALHANTAYVSLHFGLYSPSGTVWAAIDDVSLMLNPHGASTSSTHVNLGSVYMTQLPALGWNAIGQHRQRMLDGHAVKSATMKGGPKHSMAVQWFKEDEDTYDELFRAFRLNTGAGSILVPEPVPLCIDFGLGMSPHWAYYDVTSSTFNGTFNQYWTSDGHGYDIGMTFEEV